MAKPKNLFRYDAEVGDVRWCGSCAKVERYTEDHEWRHYRPGPRTTSTVLIGRAPTEGGGGEDG